MDLGIEAKAHAGIEYCFQGKKSSYRLRYSVMTSVVGVMFVPEYWQSYYELSQQAADGICFSSVHNKQSVRQELSIDLQFKRSAWRIGVQHEYLQYEANHLHFSREQVSLIIGTSWYYELKMKTYKW